MRAVLESQGDMQVNPATAQVLQSQAWGKLVIVLVTYQAVRNGGQITECLTLYETHRSPLGWVVGSGGGGCGPVGGSGEPIDIGAGQHSGSERPALSHVKGLVYDERVKTIEVVWADGERQRVEVVNSSYLVVREGSQNHAEIRALNEDDEVVAAYEIPPPAPGKEP